MIEAPMTEEAYRLLRKKVFIELGVSLALLYLREGLKRVDRRELVWNGDINNPKDLTLMADEEGDWFDAHEIEKLLSSASVDEVMKTARIPEADGVER